MKSEIKDTHTIRLEPSVAEAIREVAIEGNLSQWIRLTAITELKRLGKME